MHADQPPINDEWIRFTDKLTINHQSIVYQQTGRIRLGSDSFVRFFHPLRSNGANIPQILRSFTPFRAFQLTDPLPWSSPFSTADVEHPSLASTTKLEFMRKLLFFSSTNRCCITAVPKFHYMPGQPFREALVSVAIVPCPLNSVSRLVGSSIALSNAL